MGVDLLAQTRDLYRGTWIGTLAPEPLSPDSVLARVLAVIPQELCQ